MRIIFCFQKKARLTLIASLVFYQLHDHERTDDME